MHSEFAALTDKIGENFYDLAAENHWRDTKSVGIEKVDTKIISAGLKRKIDGAKNFDLSATNKQDNRRP